MVTVRDAILLYEESDIIERLSTGSNPDPYVIVAMTDGNRTIIDSANNCDKGLTIFIYNFH